MTSFYDLVRTHAEHDPQRPALKWADGEISYQAMFDFCNAIGANVQTELESLGRQDVVFIPLVFERSFHVPLAIHGLQFINKAYAPFDPHLPDERLRYLLQNVASPVVITTGSMKERIESLGDYRVLDIDMLMRKSSAQLKVPQISPKDAFYMTYTSGTTGLPKGVINIREGLMNRIEWMRDHYALDSDCKFLLKTPYTFDVSVCELTIPFLLGATLVVGGPKIHVKVNEVIRTIIREQITDVHFVPSVLQVFLGTLATTQLPSLKRVYCSGEGLGTELTKAFFQTGLNAELHNLYGPTEASIEVSYWKCHHDDHQRFAVTPIGRPIRQTYFHVVDENLQPRPDGEKGELLIGGIGVARGYYKLEQLTAEKFIPDPVDASRGKVYRSGDLVLKNADGDYEFFGRMDFQVKINGQRVELGEIESHLLKFEGMKRTAVFYENHELVAVIEAAPEREMSGLELSRFLEAKLPSYMIPKRFIFVADWPLSSSGKTDRKYLKTLL